MKAKALELIASLIISIIMLASIGAACYGVVFNNMDVGLAGTGALLFEMVVFSIMMEL